MRESCIVLKISWEKPHVLSLTGGISEANSLIALWSSLNLKVGWLERDGVESTYLG